jgi:hypothetical protein
MDDSFIHLIITYMVIYLGIYVLYIIFSNDNDNNETNDKNND